MPSSKNSRSSLSKMLKRKQKAKQMAKQATVISSPKSSMDVASVDPLSNHHHHRHEDNSSISSRTSPSTTNSQPSLPKTNQRQPQAKQATAMAPSESSVVAVQPLPNHHRQHEESKAGSVLTTKQSLEDTTTTTTTTKAEDTPKADDKNTKASIVQFQLLSSLKDNLSKTYQPGGSAYSEALQTTSPEPTKEESASSSSNWRLQFTSLLSQASSIKQTLSTKDDILPPPPPPPPKAVVASEEDAVVSSDKNEEAKSSTCTTTTTPTEPQGPNSPSPQPTNQDSSAPTVLDQEKTPSTTTTTATTKNGTAPIKNKLHKKVIPLASRRASMNKKADESNNNKNKNKNKENKENKEKETEQPPNSSSNINNKKIATENHTNKNGVVSSTTQTTANPTTANKEVPPTPTTTTTATPAKQATKKMKQKSIRETLFRRKRGSLSSNQSEETLSSSGGSSVPSNEQKGRVVPQTKEIIALSNTTKKEEKPATNKSSSPKTEKQSTTPTNDNKTLTTSSTKTNGMVHKIVQEGGTILGPNTETQGSQEVLAKESTARKSRDQSPDGIKSPNSTSPVDKTTRASEDDEEAMTISPPRSPKTTNLSPKESSPSVLHPSKRTGNKTVTIQENNNTMKVEKEVYPKRFSIESSSSASSSTGSNSVTSALTEWSDPKSHKEQSFYTPIRVFDDAILTVAEMMGYTKFVGELEGRSVSEYTTTPNAEFFDQALSESALAVEELMVPTVKNKKKKRKGNGGEPFPLVL